MAFDLDDPEYEVSYLKREIDELRQNWAEMLRRLGNIEPKAKPTASGGTGRVASNAGIPADCGARGNRLIDANDSRVYLGLIPALLPVSTRNGEFMLQTILYRCWLNLRFPRVAKSVASLLPEHEKDWEMFRPGALGNVQRCGCRKSPATYSECGGDVPQTDMLPLGQKDTAWEK